MKKDFEVSKTTVLNAKDGDSLVQMANYEFNLKMEKVFEEQRKLQGKNKEKIGELEEEMRQGLIPNHGKDMTSSFLIGLTMLTEIVQVVKDHKNSKELAKLKAQDKLFEEKLTAVKEYMESDQKLHEVSEKLSNMSENDPNFQFVKDKMLFQQENVLRGKTQIAQLFGITHSQILERFRQNLQEFASQNEGIIEKAAKAFVDARSSAVDLPVEKIVEEMKTEVADQLHPIPENDKVVRKEFKAPRLVPAGEIATAREIADWCNALMEANSEILKDLDMDVAKDPENESSKWDKNR